MSTQLLRHCTQVAPAAVQWFFVARNIIHGKSTSSPHAHHSRIQSKPPSFAVPKAASIPAVNAAAAYCVRTVGWIHSSLGPHSGGGGGFRGGRSREVNSVLRWMRGARGGRGSPVAGSGIGGRSPARIMPFKTDLRPSGLRNLLRRRYRPSVRLPPRLRMQRRHRHQLRAG